MHGGDVITRDAVSRRLLLGGETSAISRFLFGIVSLALCVCVVHLKMLRIGAQSGVYLLAAGTCTWEVSQAATLVHDRQWVTRSSIVFSLVLYH